MPRPSRFNKLNPAFAAAHGIVVGSNEAAVSSNQEASAHGSAPSSSATNKMPTSKRIERAVADAAMTGKLKLMDAGLTMPLPDSIFDFPPFRMSDVSLDSDVTIPSHIAETVTHVDLSDNEGIGTAITTDDNNGDSYGGGSRLDERISRYVAVRSFRARRTGIAAFPYETFHNWNCLTLLDLAGNRLSSFPFRLLPSTVQELHLSGNELRDLTIPASATGGNSTSPANLPNLLILDVSKNSVETLPDMTARSLRTLLCSDNKLKQIPTLLLNSCQATLTTLDASNNRLTNLHLADFNMLQTLDLSKNKFSDPPICPPSLVRLSLHKNNLVTIHNWPIGLSMLGVLDLSDNYIKDLGSDFAAILCAGSPNLNSLLLRGNDLRMIPPSLGLLRSLKQIELQGNPQRVIRTMILERPTDGILEYLLDRMTPSQLDEETRKIEEYKTKGQAATTATQTTTVKTRYAKPQATTAPTPAIPLMPSPAQTTPSVAPTETGAGSTPETIVTKEKEDKHNVTKPVSTQTITTATSSPKEVTSPALEEHKQNMDSLTEQLQSLSLSQAKRFALKKQLAMERSKYIREERRLKQEASK